MSQIKRILEESLLEDEMHATSSFDPQQESFFVPGVYEIRNIKNGKKYIGQARCVAARLKQHKKLLSSGNHHCYPLQEDWNRYNPFDFDFRIRHVEADEKIRNKIEDAIIEDEEIIACGYNLADGKIKELYVELERIKNQNATYQDRDQIEWEQTSGEYLSKKKDHLEKLNSQLESAKKEALYIITISALGCLFFLPLGLVLFIFIYHFAYRDVKDTTLLLNKIREEISTIPHSPRQKFDIFIKMSISEIEQEIADRIRNNGNKKKSIF